MFGADYYAAPRRYQTKVRNAQEAHEAIRPSDFQLAPGQLERVLDPDDLKVYDLIWKRTMASQMADARVLRTTMDVSTIMISADQLSISFMDITQEGGEFTIWWDDQVATAPFQVAR